MKRIALTGSSFGNGSKNFALVDDQDYYRFAPYRWYFKDSWGVVRDDYDLETGQRGYKRLIDEIAGSGPKLYEATTDRFDLRRGSLTSDPKRRVTRQKKGQVLVIERPPSLDDQREFAAMVAREVADEVNRILRELPGEADLLICD